ncbi:MAG: ribosome silencing factor [Clostridiales bacterium]|nr:ribosome silencing factor [Clostridiales bacterium]
MKSIDIVELAVKTADAKKGRDIQVIKVREISVLADYFVLITGDSSTQIKTIADEIEFKLREAGEEPHHIEGRQSGWICLDYATAVIHVFYSEQREYFKLEHLWEDGESIDIKNFLGE